MFPRFFNFLEVLVFKLSSISLVAERFIGKWIFFTRSLYLMKKVKHPENLGKYVAVQACNFYELPLFPLKEMACTSQDNSALVRADSALRCVSMVLVPLLEDCRSLRDCTERQRAWLKPMVCSSPPCCLGHVLWMLAPGSVRSSDDALMVPWAKFPCSKTPAPALWQTRWCWALPLWWDFQPGGVFFLKKGSWNYSVFAKASWPPESISCVQRQEGREGAECAVLLELIPSHSLCIFSFSCQIIDQSTGLNMHVRRKHSDNFLIMLQPVTALRHDCQFH